MLIFRLILLYARLDEYLVTYLSAEFRVLSLVRFDVRTTSFFLLRRVKICYISPLLSPRLSDVTVNHDIKKNSLYMYFFVRDLIQPVWLRNCEYLFRYFFNIQFRLFKRYCDFYTVRQLWHALNNVGLTISVSNASNVFIDYSAVAIIDTYSISCNNIYGTYNRILQFFFLNFLVNSFNFLI